MSQVFKKNNTSSISTGGIFLGAGALLLAVSIIFEQQIVAFIGLGLLFWGAIFLLAKKGKYVESSLLDETAKSGYSTIDRMLNDLKFNGQGYFLSASPKDVLLPDYLKNLKEPVVYIAENFDGKPSVDELAAGKFLSAKGQGIFVVSPGSGIMTLIEKHLQMDLSKVNLEEVTDFLPKYLTEHVNLAKTAEMSLVPGGVKFRAAGSVFESFFKPECTLKSVNILGYPVVSAVASMLAKASGKTVIIKEQTMSLENREVSALFSFL